MKAKSEEIFLQLFTLKYREFREKNIKDYLNKMEENLNFWVEENYKLNCNENKDIKIEEKKEELLILIKNDYPDIKSIEEAFVEVKMQNDFDIMFSNKLKKVILEKEFEINENIQKLYKDIFRDDKKETLPLEEIEKKVVEYYKSIGVNVLNKRDIYFLN
ncbi:MAG: hypothetical protein ACRDDY_13490 [Clostridium sp.]|uniref:hypothetical protein n=1 Tax=Clostridium sp. TaxID=1506 RepID=UPI003EE5B22E